MGCGPCFLHQFISWRSQAKKIVKKLNWLPRMKGLGTKEQLFFMAWQNSNMIRNCVNFRVTNLAIEFAESCLHARLISILWWDFMMSYLPNTIISFPIGHILHCISTWNVFISKNQIMLGQYENQASIFRFPWLPVFT
jgi:hypothetical protein